MKRWHLVFDVNKCIGCYTCMLACKDEHVGNEWLPYTDRQKKRDQKWIVTDRRERGTAPRVDLAYRPTLCNHCDDPPCAESANGCVRKRADGIVLLDPRKAAGNEALVDACPYGAISWNDEIGAAQKCTFCAHLIDEGWKEPRCVQTCPLRALMAVYMEDEEFDRLIEEKGLVSLAAASSEPRVWYKNLHRFTENMIAGEVAYYEDDGTEACAAGVDVMLIQNGETVMSVLSSTFGEFYFDPIAPNSGDYEIKAELPGRGIASAALTMGEECIDVGIMRPGMDPEPSLAPVMPVKQEKAGKTAKK